MNWNNQEILLNKFYIGFCFKKKYGQMLQITFEAEIFFLNKSTSINVRYKMKIALRF